MSTSSYSDRPAAVAAASALSRRPRNAVIAHMETLIDLGEQGSGDPIADSRDVERYHMAWFARQALAGIAPPEFLRETRREQAAVCGAAAGHRQLPNRARPAVSTPSHPSALRLRLVMWTLLAVDAVLVFWLVVAIINAKLAVPDGSLAISAVIAFLATAGAAMAAQHSVRLRLGPPRWCFEPRSHVAH